MNHIEPKESSVKIGLIKIAIVAVVVIVFMIWKKYYASTVEEEIFERESPVTFHGIVDSTYYDKGDHNVKKAILSDGYIYNIDGKWESIIYLGDSLSKNKDDLKVEVHKKDGQQVILDYRELAKRTNKSWWNK